MSLSPDDPFYPVNLMAFKRAFQTSFFSILSNIGKIDKTLVIEKDLLPLINYLITHSDLKKEHAITQISLLDNNQTPSYPTKSIVYIVTPSIDILQLVNYEHDPNSDNDIFLIFLPYQTYECFKFMKQYSLTAIWKVYNLTVDAIPLDKDLLSIENNDCLLNTFILDKDDSLNSLSRVIMNYQELFGKIKHNYIKGDIAMKLSEIVKKKNITEPIKTDNKNETLACFYIDRSVDFISPFCTPYTYEGMIDKYFSIVYNTISVDKEIIGVDIEEAIKKKNSKQSDSEVIEEKKESKKKTLDLSEKDNLYTMIKDYHFNKIRSFLPERLKQYEQIYNQTKEARELDQIKGFLDLYKERTKERYSLNNHISIAKHISEIQMNLYTKQYLANEQRLISGEDLSDHLHDLYDNMIARRVDMYVLLQLIILESQTQGGFKAKYYDYLKGAFLNAYGYKEIFLWNNLEKLKLVQRQVGKRKYEDIIEVFKLIKYDVNLLEPDDTAYAFGAYCPLSIRLIETMLRGEWGKNKEMICSHIPGKTSYPDDESGISKGSKDKKNFILLVFIGGITYGEIAAIRYLNTVMKKYKMIMLTTSVINDTKILNGLREFNNQPNSSNI